MYFSCTTLLSLLKFAIRFLSQPAVCMLVQANILSHTKMHQIPCHTSFWVFVLASNGCSLVCFCVQSAYLSFCLCVCVAPKLRSLRYPPPALVSLRGILNIPCHTNQRALSLPLPKSALKLGVTPYSPPPFVSLRCHSLRGLLIQTNVQSQFKTSTYEFIRLRRARSGRGIVCVLKVFNKFDIGKMAGEAAVAGRSGATGLLV